MTVVLGLVFFLAGLVSIVVGGVGFLGKITEVKGIWLGDLEGSYIGLAFCLVIGLGLIFVAWVLAL
jgi:hypothetical protein